MIFSERKKQNANSYSKGFKKKYIGKKWSKLTGSERWDSTMTRNPDFININELLGIKSKFKTVLIPAHSSDEECTIIKKAGYIPGQEIEEDVWEVMKKVYNFGASIALLQYGGCISEGTFHVLVSNSRKFGMQ